MITSLSPLDGRYKNKMGALSEYFSEYGLIKLRLTVEIYYLMALSAEKGVPEVHSFSNKELELLHNLIRKFDTKEAERVKAIEKTTNHDVKAVEYYLREKLEKTSLKKVMSFLHFALTSEDVNNLAYALMLKDGGGTVILPLMRELNKKIVQLAKAWRRVPLLSLTHGQPATPTTVGKEFLVFAHRLERQIKYLEKQDVLGKLNGASGNWSAHLAAYPKVDWMKFSQKFVNNLGLGFNPYTTQIEPHDYMSEIFDTVARFNTILIDFNRDVWGYISRGVFTQKRKEGEVGSSTMPHKVNPIDFENSEGNLGLANALLRHFSEKLPISRFQRDLSDSTVQRNIGTAFGYSLLAYQSTLKGLEKLELNRVATESELKDRWELLAEPIQTVMRKHGVTNAYEKLKDVTRGKKLDEKNMRAFIQSLKLPREVKERLLRLTPARYIGLADKL
ncbi:MAG: adenylosuccinate lyase [Candidatus Peregrinibacteria bacterium]